MSITIHVDAACAKPRHASGGPSRAAWLFIESGESRVVDLGYQRTPYLAELAALLGLLEVLRQTELNGNLFICLDNLHVLNWLKGRPLADEQTLRPLCNKVHRFIASLEATGHQVNLILIRSEQNRAHTLLHAPKRPGPGRPRVNPIGPKMARGNTHESRLAEANEG